MLTWKHIEAALQFDKERAELAFQKFMQSGYTDKEAHAEWLLWRESWQNRKASLRSFA